MHASRQVALILTAALFTCQAVFAGTEVVTLKWSELSAAAANREATLLLAGGVRVAGIITGVREDTLIVTIRKSSQNKTYSPGEASIPKKEISEIRLKRVNGPARLIGAAGAGAAAGLGSLGWAISDSRVNVSDSTRVAQWGAITAAAAVAGYLTGRAIDTKETIIRIAPDGR